MFNSQWIEFKSKYKQSKYPIDSIFLRTLFKFYGFFIVERIRIVQYPDRSYPVLYHSIKVGTTDKRITSKIFENKPSFYKRIYKILSKIFDKYTETYEIRNSKYIRYPFVKNLFRDIVRDEKLEQLLK